MADGTLERSWPASSNAVPSLAFTPDGSILVSVGGDSDKSVKLWRAADGTLIRKLTGHSGSVLSVGVSADGGQVASGSADGTVRLWRLSDGALLWKTSGPFEMGVGRRLCLLLVSTALSFLVARGVVRALRWLAEKVRRRVRPS